MTIDSMTFYEQDCKLFQCELPRINRKGNLAYMGSVTAKHCYCTCGYCYHHINGLAHGLCQCPNIKADLFTI